MNYVDRPLSRRDWVLMPAIGFLTALAMAGIVECVSRVVWPEYEIGRCSNPTGNRPNCVARMKNAEGPEVEYRFNDCGFRSYAQCRPKPKGTFRLVSMGTSIGMGLFIPAGDLFANRAASELAGMLHRPVDAQNMGSMRGSILTMPGKLPQALSLAPDAIVLELCPYDLLSFDVRGAEPASGAAARRAKSRMQFLMNLSQFVRESRTGYMAQHALLENDSFFYSAYAANGAMDDVLLQPPSPATERRYAGLDALFGAIEAGIRGSGVPFFVLVFPNRIAAGLMSDKIHIDHHDPEAFLRRVSSLANAHGLIAVDSDSPFKAVPHAERLFFPVDSHPGPGAHILMGHALAQRIAEYFRMQPPERREADGRDALPKS